MDFQQLLQQAKVKQKVVEKKVNLVTFTFSTRSYIIMYDVYYSRST